MKEKHICLMQPNWITNQFGGSELQLHLISDELLKRGWRVSVITQLHKPNEKYFNPRILYSYYRRSIHKYYELFLVLRCLIHCDAPIVFVRTGDQVLRAGSIIFSVLFNRRNVYSIAGDDEVNADFSLMALLGGETISKLIYNIINLPIRIISYSRFDLIICQTNHQLTSIVNHLNAKKVAVISNSARNAPGARNKDKSIVWVGNMRPVKRPEFFVKLADKFNDSGWTFKMIGRTHSKITKLYEEKKFKNFFLMGELDSEIAYQEIANARILVNTSFTEGFPNTFIEAWTADTLVVSLSVDPDFCLSRAEIGICCNDNFNLLVEIISEIINNKYDYECITSKAKSYVRENFSITSNVTKLEKHLLTLLS